LSEPIPQRWEREALGPVSHRAPALPYGSRLNFERGLLPLSDAVFQ
jgi:hypothetical protein